MKRVIVDMDGVLSNFAKAILKAHGFIYEEVMNDWLVGHYNMAKMLQLEYKTFIGPAASIDFWANMEWMSDGRLLFKLIRSYFPLENIFIWSKPSDVDGCLEGKRKWLKRHLPDFPYHQVLFGEAKMLGAKPDVLLIDDDDFNIQNFEDEEGYGCLVPRKWNSMHEYSDSSVYIVQSQLESRLGNQPFMINNRREQIEGVK